MNTTPWHEHAAASVVACSRERGARFTLTAREGKLLTVFLKKMQVCWRVVTRECRTVAALKACCLGESVLRQFDVPFSEKQHPFQLNHCFLQQLLHRRRLPASFVPILALTTSLIYPLGRRHSSSAVVDGLSARREKELSHGMHV